MDMAKVSTFSENYSYDKIDLEYARANCDLIKGISDPTENSKSAFPRKDWFAVCRALTRFSDWREHYKDVVSIPADGSMPNNHENTREKIEELLASGNWGVNCSNSTSCPKRGNRELCHHQSIVGALAGGTDKIKGFEKPPFSYEEVDSEEEIWRQLDRIFEANPTIKEDWEGVDVKVEELTEKERQKRTYFMAKDLIYAGLLPELVYQILPLYEFGVHQSGSEQFFWNKVCQAQDAIEKKLEEEGMTIEDKKREPYRLEVIKRKRNIGIWQIKSVKNTIIVTDEDGNERSEKVDDIAYQPITDFYIEQIAKVIDRTTGVFYLFKIYPKKSRGVPFQALISAKKMSDTKTFRQALTEACPELDFSIHETGEGVVNMIRYVATQNYDGKIAYMVNSWGYNEKADAYFFREKVFHKGKPQKIKEGNYLIEIGGKHFWLEYLRDDEDEIRKNVPNPSSRFYNDKKKIEEITNHWKKWAPIFWGGPSLRLNSKLLLGWFAATIYKDELMRHFKAFPLCFITGNKHSGKNYNVSVFGQLQGFEAWTEHNMTSSTTAGINRLMGGKKTIWIDEYRPSRAGITLEEIGKSAATAGKGTKAVQGDQEKTIDYRYLASLIFTSESVPRIGSFRERCILLHMDSGWRQENVELAAEAEAAMLRHRLGGQSFSEMYSYWITQKSDKILDMLIKGITNFQTSLSKNNKISASKRASLVYGTAFIGYVSIVHSFFGKKKAGKEIQDEVNELRKYVLKKMQSEGERTVANPMIDVFKLACIRFNDPANKTSDASKYKDFPVLVLTEKNSIGEMQDFMYVDGNTIYTWFAELKSKWGEPDREHGRTKILENMRDSRECEGLFWFPGKRKTTVRMYKYAEGTDVFERLRTIAYKEENGELIDYKELTKEREEDEI